MFKKTASAIKDYNIFFGRCASEFYFHVFIIKHKYWLTKDQI